MELTFSLSNDDSERLFAVKDLQGLTDCTANDFAARIVSNYLRSVFPTVPKYDDLGQLTNAADYKGGKHG
mgnify:CR=1 FL=1